MSVGADYDSTNYIPPLSVHVENLPKDPIAKECRTSHKTVILTAANPVQMVVGVDPARCEVHLEPQTNPVVMTSSISQASDLANVAAVYAFPNGRILNPLVGEYIVPGGANELWLSAGIYPTLVGVTVVREV